MTPDQMHQLADRLRDHAGVIYGLWKDDLNAAANLIEQMAKREVSEQGPWKAELWKAEQVVVASDDFEHDARLLVLGDFSDEGQRMQYAQEIARRLNMAQRVPLTEQEIWDAVEHGVIGGIGFVSKAVKVARAIEEAHGIRSEK